MDSIPAMVNLDIETKVSLALKIHVALSSGNEQNRINYKVLATIPRSGSP